MKIQDTRYSFAANDEYYNCEDIGEHEPYEDDDIDVDTEDDKEVSGLPRPFAVNMANYDYMDDETGFTDWEWKLWKQTH